MTLLELSEEYQAMAELLRKRARLVRQLLKEAEDPEERWQLQRRLNSLLEIQRQVNQISDLTAHYYERGYWRNARYVL